MIVIWHAEFHSLNSGRPSNSCLVLIHYKFDIFICLVYLFKIVEHHSKISLYIFSVINYLIETFLSFFFLKILQKEILHFYSENSLSGLRKNIKNIGGSLAHAVFARDGMVSRVA